MDPIEVQVSSYPTSQLLNTTTCLIEPPKTTTEPRLLLQKFLEPQPAIPNPRRNGKVARLPKATRDMLNRMLDDGLPARVIIDELGEAGAGLNPQNISNWVQGGYQDYLKHQDAIAQAKTQMEFATAIDPWQKIQSLGHLSPSPPLEAPLEERAGESRLPQAKSSPINWSSADRLLSALPQSPTSQESRFAETDKWSLPLRGNDQFKPGLDQTARCNVLPFGPFNFLTLHPPPPHLLFASLL